MVRRRVVFFEPIEFEKEIQIEDYAAFLIQNAGNTTVRLDRQWKLLADQTFHAMLLKEGEVYRQKIHISFGTENTVDDAVDNVPPLNLVNYAAII